MSDHYRDILYAEIWQYSARLSDWTEQYGDVRLIQIEVLHHIDAIIQYFLPQRYLKVEVVATGAL